VIDFVFANVNIQDKVLELRVEERVDSGHMPVCLELEPEEERQRRGRKRKRKRCSNGEEKNIMLGYRDKERLLEENRRERLGRRSGRRT